VGLCSFRHYYAIDTVRYRILYRRNRCFKTEISLISFLMVNVDRHVVDAEMRSNKRQ
jgi:hypothetical protein